jgi:hypothetical protein
MHHVMTVSRLPVVAVNGPVEINCINATAALSGAGSETSAVTYAWSTADGASGETNTSNIRQLPATWINSGFGRRRWLVAADVEAFGTSLKSG